MSRPDPFTHAFEPLAETRFPAIAAEAQAGHRDTADRPQFAALQEVQHLLAELESPDVLEQHPEAGIEYLMALYIAFRFWECGKRIVPVPRQRLEAAWAGARPSARPDVPGGACYLQLPERWFWAQIDPESPHEPLDGIYVVEGSLDREIALLAVLGLRQDRPGFSQISLAAPPEDFPAASASARTPLFASTLEGGDAADLRSITTSAELMHLALLSLRAIADN